MKASQPELCHKIIREEHREKDGHRHRQRQNERERDRANKGKQLMSFCFVAVPGSFLWVWPARGCK